MQIITDTAQTGFTANVAGGKNRVANKRLISSALNPICSGFVLLATIAAGGCAESYWKVPCPPGERPSMLWSRDPRTRGWNGVEVEYALLGKGDVDATVRSPDGRHQFTEHGRYWYENEHGGKPESYKDQTYLLVRFDGQEERYRFVHHPGVDRGCISIVNPNVE